MNFIVPLHGPEMRAAAKTPARIASIRDSCKI